jgi:hypothetical protein
MATTHDTQSVGVFNNLDAAERSINELRQHGFRADEIGIIGHVDEKESVPAPLGLRKPEHNVVHGVRTGGLIGAVIGALVILVIPGLAWVAEVGWWFEILGGAVLGAAAGGVLFAFGTLLFSRPSSRLYTNELEKGRFIVTVKNPARQQEAIHVLGREAIHTETERR